MKTKLFNLERLEGENLIPISIEDEKAILEHLEKNIELYYDENLRVWNEGGQYIADLAKAEEK